MVRSVEPNPRGEDKQMSSGAGSDHIERWGLRIGRALGWIVAAFLIFQLLRNYGI